MSVLIRLTSDPDCYNPGETETVVFDTVSGNTHLLTAVGAQVLDQLREARAPITLDDLLRSLKTVDPGWEVPDILQPVVAELEQLGLVKTNP